MSIIEKLEEQYNLPFEQFLNPVNLTRYAVKIPDSENYLYGFIVNNISDSKPIFTFAYDSFVTLNHLDLSLRLPFITMESPALDYRMGSAELDDYLHKVKTKKSLVLGDKWSKIKRKTLPVTAEILTDFLTEKKSKYPTANIAHERYLSANGYTGNITYGYVNNQYLFSILWYFNGSDICGTHINVTEDLELRKHYSPYILGHTTIIREGFALNAKQVRFSLYYPYKSIFGMTPTQYPSIPVSDFFKLSPEVF